MSKPKPKPMTDERLAEIDRLIASDNDTAWEFYGWQSAHELLDEVKRLRKEISDRDLSLAMWKGEV